MNEERRAIGAFDLSAWFDTPASHRTISKDYNADCMACHTLQRRTTGSTLKAILRCDIGLRRGTLARHAVRFGSADAGLLQGRDSSASHPCRAPYVIRVMVTSGVRFMPHRHPEDRLYTVVSGIFCIGLGDRFDKARSTAYPPGTVIVLPGNTYDLHCAKSGEYVTQVTAIERLGLEYVDPHDDPRNG